MNIAAVLAGLELRSRDYAVQPIDFFATAPDATLIALPGWWYADWFESQDGLILVNGPATETHSGVWDVPAYNTEINAASDGDVQRRMNLNSDRRDFDRGLYLENLQRLREEFGERVDLEPWTQAIIAKPPKHPLDDRNAKEAASRTMGRVILSDVYGRPFDAMVIDDTKEAATAHGNGWLESLAGDYRTQPRDIAVADYLNWVARQQPYAGVSVSGATVFVGTGNLRQLAREAVAKRGGVF